MKVVCLTYEKHPIVLLLSLALPHLTTLTLHQSPCLFVTPAPKSSAAALPTTSSSPSACARRRDTCSHETDLKLLICFVLDSLFEVSDNDWSCYDDNSDMVDDAYMVDVISPSSDNDNIDNWTKKALHKRNPNLIIMCVDFEGVKGRTSELGFAWYRLADLVRIVP